MTPSVVFSVFSCWFGARLDISEHVQSLLVFQLVFAITRD